MVATQLGPPSVLSEIEIEIPKPGSNEVLIRHTAIGVNFIDCYYRSGLYPWPVKHNLVLGSEAVGIVEALGSEVSLVAIGDRIAYTLPNNAYATHRTIDSQNVVKVPNGISDETAAACMLKGLTARYLLKESYKLQAGQSVLFHFTADKNWLQAAAKDLFDMILSESIKIHIHETAPLRDVASIHSDLEGRKTMGSVVLIP